jgi:hypothetical protein
VDSIILCLCNGSRFGCWQESFCKLSEWTQELICFLNYRLLEAGADLHHRSLIGRAKVFACHSWIFIWNIMVHFRGKLSVSGKTAWSWTCPEQNFRTSWTRFVHILAHVFFWKFHIHSKCPTATSIFAGPRQASVLLSRRRTSFEETNTENLEALLRGVGLEKYYPVFQSNGIELNQFACLTDQELKDMVTQIYSLRDETS